MSLVAVQFVTSTFQWALERIGDCSNANRWDCLVWFDVGQLSNRKAGILATDVYDFESSMDIKLTQDKAGRLDYSESLMTHAMVLDRCGFDENGKSTKWKVENSWGDKVVQMVTLLPSDAWMDEYTYQIVVRKELLTADEQAAYEAEPIVLAPWDPMEPGRIKYKEKRLGNPSPFFSSNFLKVVIDNACQGSSSYFESLSDRGKICVIIVVQLDIGEMKYLSSQDIKDRQRNISDIKPYKTTKEIVVSNIFYLF